MALDWFKRKDKGILTPTAQKMEAPDGLWYKTPSGKIIHTRELKNNAYVSPEDGYHVRITSRVRQELDRVLSEAFQQVWELSVERDVSLRTAAYILGIGRVDRATILGGIT